MSNKSAHMPCPYCNNTIHVVKHGYLISGKVRFKCTKCNISYTSRRNKKIIMESLPNRITEYGIRATARLVGVAPSTILNRRKIINTQYINNITSHKQSTEFKKEEITSHRQRVYIG